jgi:DNA-binding transcriptional MerR regulator
VNDTSSVTKQRLKPQSPAPAAGDALTPAAADRMFTIGELAELFSITTRTIRFYEAKGLIRPVRKGVARSYSNGDRVRMALILRGKNLGFSLEDIAEYLKLYDADPAQLAQTELLLTKVEAHIADLNSKRADIDRTLKDLRDIRSMCQRHLSSAQQKVGPAKGDKTP